MKRKRFKALIKEIEKNPSRHNQGSWINGLKAHYETYSFDDESHIPERVKEDKRTPINCGTTGCLAGLGSLRYAPIGTKFWGDFLELPDSNGDLVRYSDYGRKVLGLTRAEASYLFAAHRDWAEIVEFSDMKKEERTALVGEF